MAATFKGIKKSFKYIAQIFAVKEQRELEIGYPTDVKHVAHIGWDGPSGNGPSWMNEFKTAPDFTTSLGNLDELRDNSSLALTPSWSSQDFEDSIGSQSTPSVLKGIHSAGVPRVPKKPKRKKTKSTSSSESLSTSSRQLRAVKSKSKQREREAATIAQVYQIQDYEDIGKDLAM
ncbi:hypothetical protein HN51_029240 [Arachis hypogaea]|uniref:CRIB domain-containing protein n=2 Tax=Arachis TaxID=3817 RepID=A0A445BFH5_ARAHY|nr:CRIB domain-containing protein RIC10 [Arachis duranensis]XP_025620359.1 CRIB domain-containing protein RIC10 [Arachis hypogaea]XP_057732886.1 CRIB domain-containing protein RIC10 [Arachis stenosperma]QHO35823.1 CRIB domain-containing protein [Arachis hypogaea]RYR37406.1 hypothetical protein Ahy_A09g042294 [Arachis hypogaea]